MNWRAARWTIATHHSDTYYPCWTDSYSSQGLSGIAEALAEIGHPDGARLVKEAKDYREDILDVMRRTRNSDPGAAPIPSDSIGRRRGLSLPPELWPIWIPDSWTRLAKLLSSWKTT